MRMAKPARTVPISQRCTVCHTGLLVRNAAMEPAMTAIRALTLTLMTICVNPVSYTHLTLPTNREV